MATTAMTPETASTIYQACEDRIMLDVVGTTRSSLSFAVAGTALRGCEVELFPDMDGDFEEPTYGLVIKSNQPFRMALADGNLCQAERVNLSVTPSGLFLPFLGLTVHPEFTKIVNRATLFVPVAESTTQKFLNVIATAPIKKDRSIF